VADRSVPVVRMTGRGAPVSERLAPREQQNL
jgi:hypothetical protein